MPVELACSQCHGRLLVDQFGVVVACPHCGTHLSIPAELDPAHAAAPAPPAAVTVPVPVPAPVVAPPVTQPTSLPTPPTATDDELPDFMRPVTDDDPHDVPDFSDFGGIDTQPKAPTPQEPPQTPPVVAAPALETPAEPAAVLGPVSLVDAKPPASAVPAGPVGGSEDQPDEPGPVQFPRFDGIEAIDDEPAFPSFGPPPSDSAPLIQTDSQIVGGEAVPSVTETAAAGPDPSSSSITIDTATEPPPALSSTPQPASAPTAAAAPASVAAAAPGRRGQSGRKTLPNAVFQVWLSYTIIVSFLLFMLAWRTFGTAPSRLESLPDVKPPMTSTGQVERRLARTYATMPRGHTLTLGESRRFGNVRVTPLKITRGPLGFVHYATGAPKSETAGPVLKLWLKFENVSDDQTIAPLDAALVYYRNDQDRTTAPANNFLATAAGKKSGDVVLMYDHLVDGNWDIAGQHLGHELSPGEELTTFIPSDGRGLDELDNGPLLWRVHFRKGYSPAGYGVTTLIEVQFTPDDVQADAASAKPTDSTTV